MDVINKLSANINKTLVPGMENFGRMAGHFFPADFADKRR
jgi:hypothetical protein